MNPTLTRFRVQTTPPLEPLKVWHTFSSESGLQCIADLARNIVLALGLGTDGNEVVLELDGFALLPSSPAAAIRDGDIITVRCKPHMEKRKASEETRVTSNVPDKPQKRRKTHSLSSSPATTPQPAPVPAASKPHTTVAVNSSRLGASRPPLNLPAGTSKLASSSDSDEATSTDSDSSSDTTSDDSDSGSDSSTESSTDSDSDSDSEDGPTPQPILRQSAPPLAQPIKPQKLAALTQPTRSISQQPPAPPGQGKQSTKSRNARRRVLRKHQAAGTALPPSTAPELPTPVETEPAPTTTQAKPTAPIAPAKNANKNKRKGFDKDMAETVATRITYGTPTPAESGPVEPRGAKPSAPLVKPSVTKSRYTHYHVVPPSQLKDLPSNVIVTSVDVEAMDGMEGVGEWFDGATRETEQDAIQTTKAVEAQGATGGNGTKVDWEMVDTEWERSWDSFSNVGLEGWKSLQVGTLLAWKALTIDPLTCTPCTKIHLARVTAPADHAANHIECFVIDRPGAGVVGFGFGGRLETDEAEEGGETGEKRTVEAGEMEAWKVI